ncbi:hypothetical protein QLL95_gp0787 [Cotonvirus japonicus]|uniref:DNA primase n=1 Tax=Cotonvirus japonicus TaxID=2811091 RepID=A0ABM7NT98_9VIRU|nr:hypothetical protein QLL95_gp0787 [Cotonvirus japonicus]BCS83336.1 hypothetical protein [Cotonvirus japonicus]
MSDSVELHNESITRIKYFKIDDAISCPIMSKTAFIIANERVTTKGRTGRYFTVFPSFKKFMENRYKYKHCHEIFVDHMNNKPNLGGRLVFDFDIEYVDGLIIPENFKKQVNKTILKVISKYFIEINISILEFVWSTSINKKKLSKHLTVKHLYFDDWIIMTKIFYKLFCKVWDKKYNWILSQDLIDSQIVRKKGSLRMVDSTKINGNPLILDNNNHKLTDSLIRIYYKNHRDAEQTITRNNLNEKASDIINTNLHIKDQKYNTYENNISNISNNISNNIINNPTFDDQIYEKAFELYNLIHPGIFKPGKINGNFLTLIRVKPNHCFLSKKLHEQENAFLCVKKDTNNYVVSFGCYRYCHTKKISTIGYIKFNTMNMELSPFISKKYNSKNIKSKDCEFHQFLDI